MMKKLFFLILFIIVESVSLGKCLSKDHEWGEENFKRQDEIVRNKKIEQYPNLNLKTLTQMVNTEITLTEDQIRQILCLQQLSSHQRFVKLISKINSKMDKEKRFEKNFLGKLGKCLYHFQKFILSSRNRKLFGQLNLNKEDLNTKLRMVAIHNDWGNVAKHDHECDDDNNDENIENALRFLSPANVRPVVQVPLEVKPEGKPTVVAPPVKPTVVAPPVKPTVVEPPVKPTVVEPPVKPTVVEPPVKPTVVAPPVRNLSTEKRIIQNFIIKEYKRNLVTDFIEACPYGTQQYLVINSDISQGTISKLKSPGTYGPLNPSARRFWTWLQSNTVDDLKNKLYLSDQGIKEMAQKLYRK